MMTSAVAEILDAALALTEPERAELAALLDASIVDEPGSRHPDWSGEIRRRAAEVESGHVKPESWDEVRRQVLMQLDATGPENG